MGVGILKDSSYKLILSTETLPTVANEGDMYLELDTGKVYFWHVVSDTGTWYTLGEAVD